MQVQQRLMSQEIEKHIRRNVGNFKNQQKLASVGLFEAMSKKKGRLDWDVVVYEFFPLLGFRNYIELNALICFLDDDLLGKLEWNVVFLVRICSNLEMIFLFLLLSSKLIIGA
jgi:hypothetical protein